MPILIAFPAAPAIPNLMSLSDYCPEVVARTQILINAYARTCYQLCDGRLPVSVAVEARDDLLNWAKEHKLEASEVLAAAQLRHADLTRVHHSHTEAGQDGRLHKRDEVLLARAGMWALPRLFDEDRAYVIWTTLNNQIGFPSNRAIYVLAPEWFTATN